MKDAGGSVGQQGGLNDPYSVIGDRLGLAFPTTIETLKQHGTDFLTAAFQATGQLGPDNRVTGITEFTEFFGGGMGRKLLLSVAYERSAEGLQERLFVKFPRDFGDPLRALFAPLMEPEVRFALLSRREGFPIAVPKCYFADYNAETTSGILITERIAYGQGTIEPAHDKCLDYELADPLGHYRALTKTMAKLAAHHKSGRLGNDIQQQFPFDAKKVDTGSRLPYSREQLLEKLEKLRNFARAAPQLFPESLGGDSFLSRFSDEVVLVLDGEDGLRAYLNSGTDYIALCHWNMNLDNAWFWRDDAGEIQAGLLDWGSVAQMNVAQAFFGMICCAETGFLNEHKHSLIELFVAEYSSCGGPELAAEELALFVRLSVALLGVAWILDAPSLIETELPDFAMVRDRYDPKIKNNFLARAQLQLLIVFLNEWRFDGIATALRKLVI